MLSNSEKCLAIPRNAKQCWEILRNAEQDSASAKKMSCHDMDIMVSSRQSTHFVTCYFLIFFCLYLFIWVLSQIDKFLWNGIARIVKKWGKSYVGKSYCQKVEHNSHMQGIFEKKLVTKETFDHRNFLHPDAVQKVVGIKCTSHDTTKYQSELIAYFCQSFPFFDQLSFDSKIYWQYFQFIFQTIFNFFQCVFCLHLHFSVIFWLFWIRVIINNDFPK